MKVRSHVNFALIKYWGKKDEEYKIPHQSSLSFTVDKLYTETSVVFDYKLTKDEIIINGKKEGKEVLRVRNYLNKLRLLYKVNSYCYLESVNFVPTASGLASSASAFASIAHAFLNHLNLSKEELSKAARLGSGSASRSIYGGFSIWNHGTNHHDSYASSLNINWNEFTIIVCLVNKDEKEHSSSDAMKLSTMKSSYSNFVSESKNDLEVMIKALNKKDIDMVGSIAERNSNRMHDLIEETGIKYKNEGSFEIIEIIESLRSKGIKAYYTMDAGPNVKIITIDKYVNKIVENIPYETIICKSGESSKVII